MTRVQLALWIIAMALYATQAGDGRIGLLRPAGPPERLPYLALGALAFMPDS